MQKIHSLFSKINIALFILLLFSCVKSRTGLSEKEKAALTEEVRTTLNTYYDDIKKNGLTAEFNYLDHTSDFYWSPPGFNAPISYDEVEKGVKQNASMFKSVDNSWVSLRVDPLTAELASYTGTIHSVVTDTSGQTGDYKLIETGLMIKRNNGWKLFRGQTSVLP